MIYRPAILQDSDSVLKLNNKYCQAFFDNEKEKGFLKFEFTLSQIQTLIIQNEVVVAEWEENVIGYYLTNSIFEMDTILKRKIIVNELIQSGTIEDAKYVFLTQAAVDKSYMGKGIAKEMLKTLKRLVKDKFDYLIGLIDFENYNAKVAHLKSGWVIFAETETGWLAMTETNVD